MPRLRVHYACDHCGRQSSAEYFDYRYHETEAVQAPCGGCGYMSQHTPQRAERITDGDRSTEQYPDASDCLATPSERTRDITPHPL